MEREELKKRIDDLRRRALMRGIVTRTPFLTPAEQYALNAYCRGAAILSGGQPDCERCAAFFLPEDSAPEDFDPAAYLCAVRVEARGGAPGHRDYLGAALGLGIARESIGDIRICGETAYLFCLPAVQQLLIDELRKVGRFGVTASACALSDVPAQPVRVRSVSFTVKSMRLDAILGSMFGMSRTAAAERIRMGEASLNYAVTEKPDAPVKEGDILSLRGHGKGRVKAVGGRSKKDRLFLETEVYL